MCIGIPMQVCEMQDYSAWCAESETSEKVLINMMLVGSQPPQTWVLTFQGSALRVMDEQEALQVQAALTALGQAMAGDVSQIDVLFADLVDREPPLPEHLQQQVKSHD
jgi:hydrogenase assembly chaperone HypC/HupF